MKILTDFLFPPHTEFPDFVNEVCLFLKDHESIQKKWHELITSQYRLYELQLRTIDLINERDGITIPVDDDTFEFISKTNKKEIICKTITQLQKEMETITDVSDKIRDLSKKIDSYQQQNSIYKKKLHTFKKEISQFYGHLNLEWISFIHWALQQGDDMSFLSWKIIPTSTWWSHLPSCGQIFNGCIFILFLKYFWLRYV